VLPTPTATWSAALSYFNRPAVPGLCLAEIGCDMIVPEGGGDVGWQTLQVDDLMVAPIPFMSLTEQSGI
jgi:hypothetical protein